MMTKQQIDEALEKLGQLDIEMSKPGFSRGLNLVMREVETQESRAGLLVRSAPESPAAVMPIPVLERVGLVRFAMSHVVTSALVAVIVLGGLATTVIASKDSLPDNPLYTVKRGVERGQLILSFSDQAKAKTQAKHLSRRVAEVEKLIAEIQTNSKPESSQRVIKAIAEARDQAEVVKEGIDKLDVSTSEEDIQHLAETADEIVNYQIASSEPLETVASEIKEAIEPATAALAQALDEVKVAVEQVELVTAVGGPDSEEGDGQLATTTAGLLGEDGKELESASTTDEVLGDVLGGSATSSESEILEVEGESQEVDDPAPETDEPSSAADEGNLTTPEILIDEEVSESGLSEPVSEEQGLSEELSEEVDAEVEASVSIGL